MLAAVSRMVPAQVTTAKLDAEMPSILALATRRGWAVEPHMGDLALDFRKAHPADGSELLLSVDFRGYPALPPTWVFIDTFTRERIQSACPAPGSTPELPSSVFIRHNGRGVICAHWNLDAYVHDGNSGPHGDWGAPSGWMNAAQGNTRAGNVAEMLSTVDVHLSCSPGRLQ
jgi:hypothetical protein